MLVVSVWLERLKAHSNELGCAADDRCRQRSRQAYREQVDSRRKKFGLRKHVNRCEAAQHIVIGGRSRNPIRSLNKMMLGAVNLIVPVNLIVVYDSEKGWPDRYSTMIYGHSSNRCYRCPSLGAHGILGANRWTIARY